MAQPASGRRPRRKLADAPTNGRCGGFLLVTLAVLLIVPAYGRCQDSTNNLVEFGLGFFEPEQNASEKWRWMSEQGVVRLWNTRQGMTIKIAGRVPIGAFKQQPIINVALNGAVLEQFEAPQGDFRKEYVVSAAQQGPEDWSELRLQTSKTAAPLDFLKNSTDARQLGFKLYELAWEAESGAPIAPDVGPPPPQRRLVWLITAAMSVAVFVLFGVFARWRANKRRQSALSAEQ